MEEHHLPVIPDVKIEIDVAEELATSWLSQPHIEVLQEPIKDNLARNEAGSTSDAQVRPSDQTAVLVQEECTCVHATNSFIFQQETYWKQEWETGLLEPVCKCPQSSDLIEEKLKKERSLVKLELTENVGTEPSPSECKSVDLKQERERTAVYASEDAHGGASNGVGATEAFVEVKPNRSHAEKAGTEIFKTDNSRVLANYQPADFLISDRSSMTATHFYKRKVFSHQHSHHTQNADFEAGSGVNSKLLIPTADSHLVTENRQCPGCESFANQNISGQRTQMSNDRNNTVEYPPFIAPGVSMQKHTLYPSVNVPSLNKQKHGVYPPVSVLRGKVQNYTSDQRPDSGKECSDTFKLSRQLIAHMRKHTGQKPHLCDECGATFKWASHLNEHMRKHTGQRPFSCKECNATFRWSGNLTVHMRQHTGQRPFSCKECSATFTGSGHLTSHMRKHTGERPYSCKECSATFRQSGHLTSHMRQHTGHAQRPFSCKECSATFRQSGHLTSHMRQHTGHAQRPFSCKECSATFRQSGHLTSHMRQHTGHAQRPFSCKECSATFRQSGHLTSHMRQHTGHAQRPFSCKECSATFRQSGHLTSHMRQHTGHAQRPFSCKECSATFRQSGHLTAHMRQHTGHAQRPFSCKDCSATFSSPVT